MLKAQSLSEPLTSGLLGSSAAWGHFLLNLCAIQFRFFHSSQVLSPATHPQPTVSFSHELRTILRLPMTKVRDSLGIVSLSLHHPPAALPLTFLTATLLYLLFFLLFLLQTRVRDSLGI